MDQPKTLTGSKPKGEQSVDLIFSSGHTDIHDCRCRRRGLNHPCRCNRNMVNPTFRLSEEGASQGALKAGGQRMLEKAKAAL